MWIHEQPVLPRAFLVAHAVRTAEPVTVLRDPAFDPARDAVTSQVALDEPELRYLPRGLLPGAVAFLATLTVLGALSVRRYRSAAAR
jgi:hypothetical protein